MKKTHKNMKKEKKILLKKNIKIDSKILQEYDKLQNIQGINLHKRGDYRAGKSIHKIGTHSYRIYIPKEPIKL